jgi:hypothetical protein
MKYSSYIPSIFLGFSLALLGCAGAGAEKGGHTREIQIAPAGTIIRGSGYQELGIATGESSTLFLFGMIPVTNPLNIEYAISQAVQKYPGGQSIVGLTIWHETHYYFPIGRVSVVKVKGMVIRLDKTPIPTRDPNEQPKGDIQDSSSHQENHNFRDQVSKRFQTSPTKPDRRSPDRPYPFPIGRTSPRVAGAENVSGI